MNTRLNGLGHQLIEMANHTHELFGVSHCLRLAKVKLIGHPQIFRKLYYVNNGAYISQFQKMIIALYKIQNIYKEQEHA